MGPLKPIHKLPSSLQILRSSGLKFYFRFQIGKSAPKPATFIIALESNQERLGFCSWSMAPQNPVSAASSDKLRLAWFEEEGHESIRSGLRLFP